MFFKLCLITSIVCYKAAVRAEDARSCPGGYQHGETFETGRYWYECRDGQRVPKGCLSDSGSRVEVQDTFDTDQNRMQCVLGADGYLTILYKSCVYQGREYEVNGRWDDGQIYYVCKKDNSAVHPQAIGCVFENRQMEFEDRVAKGEKVLTCKKVQSGRVDMAVTGCARDGSKFNIGETATSDTMWYTCTDSGWKEIGCVHQGVKLRDGDTFRADSVLYKCVVNDGKTGPQPYGCITRNNGVEEDKKFDCTWTEGDDPYKYEYKCVYDSYKNTAVKVPLRCRYHQQQGSFNLEPGCYYKGNGIVVGCIKDYSTGLLQTKTFPEDSLDTSLGLREC
jgi:hypothetical protein